MPNRHHYVPAFLLATFTDGGTRRDQLWATNLATGQVFRPSVDGIAHERGLYEVDVDGLDPESIEQAFAEFEGMASPVIREMIRERKLPWSSKKYSTLISFAAMMATRGPRIQQDFERSMSHSMQAVLELSTETKERFVTSLAKVKKRTPELNMSAKDYEWFRDMVASREHVMGIDRTSKVKIQLEMQNEIFPYFAGRKWNLLRASASQQFITSDAPARLIWAAGTRPPFAPGYGLRHTDFRLPLTPALALSAKFENQYDETSAVDDAFVGHFNRGTIGGAERFVFSHIQSFFFLTESGNQGTVADAMAIHAKMRTEREQAVRTVTNEKGERFIISTNPNAALDS